MKEILVDDKTIYFAGIREGVKIPTKRESDAGYDIYANFEGTHMIIPPHTTVMIPTGLKSAFSNKWYIQLVERGSTGTKGIAQRAGVIDSGFRGEWFVPITNTTTKNLVIVKDEHLMEVIKYIDSTDVSYYPYEKAICQAVLLEVPKVNIKTISEEELMSISSDRGTGMLGSSQK